MAPVTVKPPKKAKGISKKGKKGWRKNVDISQVEDYIEEKILEERLGGAFVDRADDELFTIDKDAAEDAEEKEPERISWKKRRGEEKPLKCFQHLEIKGGADDPKKGRNRRKTPEERRNPTLVAQEQKLAQNGFVKAKAKMQKQHRELEGLKKAASSLERSTRRRTNFDFDLWSDNKSKADSTQVQEDEWLEVNTKLHTLKNTGKLSRKAPKDLHDKPSDLKAVETPHAGLSYNPSLKDHQELLWKAAVVEINKEKAEHKIEYHTTRMFPKADKAHTKESLFKEMAEGIAKLDQSKQDEESDLDNAADDSDEDEESKSFKPKTKKQKNREKREKYEENVKKAELEDKKKSQDVFRLKSMKKQINLSDKVSEVRAQIKEVKKVEKRSLPAVLSGSKFEEPEIPLKLSDELTGNLRNMKPEGNLLEDRFKSLQKRNVIETRNKGKIAKAKLRKKVEKRSYKMGFAWENQGRKRKQGKAKGKK